MNNLHLFTHAYWVSSLQLVYQARDGRFFRVDRSSSCVFAAINESVFVNPHHRLLKSQRNKQRCLWTK